MNPAEMTDGEIEAENIALGQQADAIRERRKELIAELRARQSKKDVEAAIKRALGDSASVIVEGQTITVNVGTGG